MTATRTATAVPVTVTVSLLGQVGTIEVTAAAAQQHIDAGLPAGIAYRFEALTVFGAQLVERQIKRYGVASGDALAARLEHLVLEAVVADA